MLPFHIYLGLYEVLYVYRPGPLAYMLWKTYISMHLWKVLGKRESQLHISKTFYINNNQHKLKQPMN